MVIDGAMTTTSPRPPTLVALAATILLATAADRLDAFAEKPDPKAWQQRAVWYQIFPERFRNGDPSNDPGRDNLDQPQYAPASWRTRAWESDWYARDAWEQARGPSFYHDGVSERRYGGDLQGIIDKLDYIKDLGATAIYLNPVFASRSHHKYDKESFHHIEPTFGPDPSGDREIMAMETEDPSTWQWTAADRLFLKLLGEAHARDIRVIIDGVFNHCGTAFFAFQDLAANGAASRFKDWFEVHKWDDPSTPENEFAYAGWCGVSQMPEFAEVWEGSRGDLAPGVKAYLMASTRRWMDPNGDGNPSDGIDGWRLDVSWMVPEGFWQDWNKLVHDINPSAYTVTEIWKNPTTITLGGHFDATMNYEGFAMPVKGWLFDTTLKPSAFIERMDRTRGEWPAATAARLQNLLDSHDTPRAASAAFNADPGRQYLKPHEFDLAVDESVLPLGNPSYKWWKPDETAWKLVRMGVVLQMTYTGTPFIYYGSEAGMWGANDPDCRKPMVWPDTSHDAESIGPDGRRTEPRAVRFDESIHAFHRAAIALRRSHGVLDTGGIRWLHSDDGANTLAFLRWSDDSALVTAFNRSHEPRTISFEAPAEWPDGGARTIFVSDGGPALARRDGGNLVLELPPLTAAVFAP